MSVLTRSVLLLYLVGKCVTPDIARGQSLGEAVVLSSLGDPVEVEIPLSDWRNIDLQRVKLGNATRQQYDAFKLHYLPILDSMSYNVVGPTASGEVKILVSSRKPVTEPYIELLLALRWAEGSTLREYVLLFDPPKLPGQKTETEQVSSSVVTQPPVTPLKSDPALAVRDPLPEIQPKARSAEPRVEPPKAPTVPTMPKPDTTSPDIVKTTPKVEPKVEVAPRVTTSVVAPQIQEETAHKQYKVRANDSLWSIARQFQPTGIGTNSYQFLLSLYELNRSAFLEGNLAMLKADAVLTIPAARDVVAINAGSAQQIFERRWREALVSGNNTPPAEATAVAGGAVEKPTAPTAQTKTAEKKLPGVERREDQKSESILAPASEAITPTTAAATTASTVSVGLPAATVITSSPAATTGSSAPGVQNINIATQKANVANANPFLQQLTESAGAIQGLLQTRHERLQALEQQILAMQNQLQEAQQKASAIKQNREQLQAAATRKAVLLGLLAAGLLVVLGVTLKMAWQWNQDAKRMIARRKS